MCLLLKHLVICSHIEVISSNVLCTSHGLCFKSARANITSHVDNVFVNLPRSIPDPEQNIVLVFLLKMYALNLKSHTNIYTTDCKAILDQV